MKIIILGAAIFLSAGCVSNQNDLGETFGAALASNSAAQIVDPTPAEGAPEADGAAVDLATLRYKTDKVKPPSSGVFKPGAQSTGNQSQ